jgi:Predicted transcriptional regulators
MPLNIKIIGQRVKESRIQKHMSQADLAGRVDVSVTYISYIETIKKQASLESLVRIADVLGVTVDQLLNGNQVHDSAELRKELAQLFADSHGGFSFHVFVNQFINISV